MSIYVGKNNNNQNILHMTSDTRSESELKGGLLDDTVFHSQRPYLTVASYQNGSGQYIPRIGTYRPDYINDNNNNGYVLSQEAGDDALEMLEYVGGGGLIDFNKPFIMLCYFRTHSDGWTWVLGHTAPYKCMCTTDNRSSNYVSYGVNTIKNNSTIEIRVGIESSGISVSDAGYRDLAPSMIKVIQLEHDITNFDSTELDGPITISGEEGVKVGNTNFFSNSYLRFSNSVPSSGDYYEITLAPNKQTYLCLSYIPLSSSRVSVDLKAGSITANNIPIFDNNNIHLRKVPGHVEVYNMTEDMFDSGKFVLKSHNDFVHSSDLSLIATYWVCIDVTNVFGSFTAGDAVAVFLRVRWKNAPDSNPRYKIFNGLYTLDYLIGMQLDLYNYNETFESSGLMTGTDNRIYFIFNAQDEYVYDGVWKTDGNVVPDGGGHTSYVTEVKGWIAEITGGSEIPNNGKKFSLISNQGSTTVKASEVYDTTKSRVSSGGYGFNESEGTFTSTNTGVDNSFSFTEFSVIIDTTVNWEVSSEATYDKLYIWKNETLVVNEPSSGSESTYRNGSFSVASGDKVSIAYSKDSSGSFGDDKATVTLV